MALFFTAVSGIAWTIVYLEAIRVGVREKTYAIPIAALALNFAWEVIYAYQGLTNDFSAQSVANLVWAICDVFIIYTFFRYGRTELPAFVTQPLFLGWTMLVFAASFVVHWLFLQEFGWMTAARYTAFLQNLLMSGLFISMFIARQGPRGQSMVIAVAKWIGTLAATCLFGIIYNVPLLLGLGLLCSVFDLVYIGLLWWAKRDSTVFRRAGISVNTDVAPQPAPV